MFRRVHNKVNYERNLIPGQHFVSYYNATYKDKIKLVDVIGRNPERGPKIEPKRFSGNEMKRAFESIFPVSKNNKKRDNKRKQNKRNL